MRRVEFAMTVALGAAACDARRTPPPEPPEPTPAVARAPDAAPPAAVDDEARGMAAYEARQWRACAEALAAATVGRTGPRLVAVLYNGACCLARDGQRDAAFASLDRAIAAGFTRVDHLEVDPDLESLRADPRWAPMIDSLRAGRAAWERALGDRALRLELLEMVEADQRVRRELQANPAAFASIRRRGQTIDRRNTKRMKAVIAAHGWPDTRMVGDDGEAAAFLLVQHADADLAFQRLCLAKLERAVQAGRAPAEHYAYLYDRIAVAEHRPQRYGTQFDGLTPYPIEDEAGVDARRAAIGLASMTAYREEIRRMYGPPP